MEFYDVFNQDYIRVARNREKQFLVKVESLDEQEFVISEITDDIIIDSLNLDVSYEQGTQAKCSFSVINNGKYGVDENSPFWFNKKIKLYIGLVDRTTQNVFWFSKGVFIITGVSVEDTMVSISCVDKFGQFTADLGASCLHESSKINAGENIDNIYRKVLGQDKGNGRPIDSIKPIIDIELRTKTLGQDIEMGEGTYIGEILTELATTTKCRIKYDNQGRLRVTKGSIDSQYVNKSSVWDFDDNKTADFLNITAEYNFPNVKNKVTVWGESFDGQTFKATAINNSPLSPVCVDKVGYRVDNSIEDLYGYEQENVDAFAEMYLSIKTIQEIGINLDCTVLPHIDVEDCVSVTHPNLKFNNDRFFVTGVNFSGSKMSLTLANVDNLPWQIELQ